MKYFTKEWHELCQKNNLHLHLEEEKQAETFSEEYFQQLYHIELNSWLTVQEEANLRLKSHENYEPFNKEKGIEQFHDIFIHNLMYLKKQLPETIVKQIADIRVFTLDKATRNVINAVTQFCEENYRIVTTVIEDYKRYIKENSTLLDIEIDGDFSFHDCKIIKSIKNDKSLKLLLDNKVSDTNIDEVIFENINIIKQDDLLEDSWWLYEEIYKVNDKYEFHVLLQNKTEDLIDFIISAEQISFISNKNNL
ncbi:DUF4085 family protein [Lysinibacillus sphaericus]|uniref:DUF4085 domain-containing protein n=2 Tax=Lysinibacillus sphaericus TaxID=1421 RepID=A0A2S0JY19_LYSSH|nr:DUF4085 family protein [Lysinibacillus sphaericus]AVK95991.1 hypothetical protein LS41612_06895 [Lysinibacillus sphaericus]MED4544735.1 DUF4085 family protein [Lysinibacillus sphaericus]TKI20855.1 DUF4085 family protein [Lysinibacillus sphaericus]SUV18253.1 Uncharacterised protein [Lysinibacillus sphaericus]GEC83599.1 hypothetical protein LSP03_33420 [Lysinibacillus sphaericus]